MKKHIYAILFSIALIGCVTYTLLDTFLIPHYDTNGNYETSEYITENVSKKEATNITVTDSTYEDDNIKIVLKTERISNTNIYIADIYCDASFLKTALANNAYGTNVTARTSVIAKANNAILAINGDFYGANKQGYVIKNGILYRTSARSTSYDDLAIYADGTWGLICEKNIAASELLDNGVINLFAFGPALVDNGLVTVSSNEEVGKAMNSNPRTAIGYVEPGHYIFLVSDGRTSDNTGLTLYQLADVLKDLGCQTAYNLDGGGSSTMYFNGRLINNPTTSGRNTSERAVSDIVYVGY